MLGRLFNKALLGNIAYKSQHNVYNVIAVQCSEWYTDFIRNGQVSSAKPNSNLLSNHEKVTKGSLENEYVNLLCEIRRCCGDASPFRTNFVYYCETVLSFSSKLHMWGVSALKIYSGHYSVSSYNLVRLTC